MRPSRWRRLRMSSVVSSQASSIRSPDCSSSSSSAQSQKRSISVCCVAGSSGAVSSAAVASCQRRVARARSLGTSRSRSRIAAAWRLVCRRRAFSKPTPTRSWRSSGTAGGAHCANGESVLAGPAANVGEEAADVDQPLVGGQPVLVGDQARLPRCTARARSIACGMKASMCARRTCAELATSGCSASRNATASRASCACVGWSRRRH